MPANSTVLAEWWAEVNGKGMSERVRFQGELRAFRQVRDWDLDEKRTAIDRALPSATTAAEFVAMVEDGRRARTAAMSRAANQRNAELDGSRRRAVREGRCIHNVAGRPCPLCEGRARVVYISGGGLHWHLDRRCLALEKGQENVRLRGGNVEEIKSYGRNEPKVLEKDPCLTCLRNA